MEMILDGVEYAEIKDYLEWIIPGYRAGKFSLDEIGIPGGIGKSLDDYETDDAQVRAPGTQISTCILSLARAASQSAST